MRNSFSLPCYSGSDLADDREDDAFSVHLEPLLLPPPLTSEGLERDLNALARDMADCLPVRAAILDARLRVRALNDQWEPQNLPAGGELGCDFAQTCLATASGPDRDAIVAGLSALARSGRLGTFSASLWLRSGAIPQHFALRARKLPQSDDLIVVTLLDVTGQNHAEAERRHMLRVVLDVEEAERKRIARELHDETVQQLAVMQLGLAGLRQARGGADLDVLCRDMEGVLQAVQKELRTLSYMLHPPEIDGGLVEALRSFVRGLARRTHLNATFVDETKGLLTGDEVDRALYRVTQEALINVCKHAGARQAFVRLKQSDEHLVLEIEDDGIGIPAELCASRADARMGVGLSAMRERIEALSGRLEISRLQRGTRVRAVLPCLPLYH